MNRPVRGRDARAARDVVGAANDGTTIVLRHERCHHGMMIDMRVRLGDGGRLVIPADVRRHLGFEAGDELVLRVVDGELRVSTIDAAIERVQRRLAPFLGDAPPLVAELIAERRRAAEGE